MKILHIVGARPNFIKIAPIMKELSKYNIKQVLVHTGQHYDPDMSEVFFQQLNIPKPKINLYAGSGSHAEQTATIMLRLEKVLIKQKPDLVLVVGDVNSTLAGALTAVKLNIPIAHVEAGMRSFDRRMPEEINRVLTDHVSDLLFCSTTIAVTNLKKEGITTGVHIVGDIMYDAGLQNIKIAEKSSKILEKLHLMKKQYLLATIHRQTNTDNKESLREILHSLSFCGERVVLPLHPRTKNYLKKYNIHIPKESYLQIVDPVSYLDMLVLEKNAKKIITDSGGIQKEAYFFKIPCITLRDRTEWIETVKGGWNVLVGADKEKITQAINSFDPKSKQHKYYGNADAAKKIVKIIAQEFSLHDLSIDTN